MVKYPFLRLDGNLGNFHRLASGIVRGAVLDPGHGLVVVTGEVLPANGPLICETSS